MTTNIKESYYSHDSLLPPQQFRSEVDSKYYNSYSNQIYVFPRALSTESSLDSSMKSLAETVQYNLHTQNPHTDAVYSHIRSSFKDSRTQKMGSNPLIEVKSAERGRKVEESREKGETKNKKGVSLGPEELIGLYKKKMSGYKIRVKENLKVSPEAIQELLEACEAKKKGLVLKLVKGKGMKEKEPEQVYGIRQRIVEPLDKKGVDVVQKKEVRRIAGLKERKETREVRESRESKQSKGIVSFSKGFSEFLKQAKDNLLAELANNEKETVEVKAEKKEKEDDGRQAQEDEVQKEVVQIEKRLRTSGMSLSQKKTSEMELKDKMKRNEVKPDIKKLDLYKTFKTKLSSKPVNPAKTTSSLVYTQSPKAAERLQSQESKVPKTLHLIKAASEVRESRQQIKQEKPKEPINYQSRDPVTRDKTKEMRDLRLSSNKKVSICSTQLSEGMSTSRKASRPRATSNNKGGSVMYIETQKSQRDRLHTEEKRERKDLIKEIVARTLDMARTTPMKYQDLQEFKDLKKSLEKRKNKEKIVKKEKKPEKKEEKGLAMSIVVESPTTCRRRRDGPMSRVNLKVKTHSVVREYEARQREKLEARRKFADVRKFV